MYSLFLKINQKYKIENQNHDIQYFEKNFIVMA